MATEYDWTQLTVHMHDRTPLSRVFAAWATPAGLASFFVGSARAIEPSGVERAPDEHVRAGDALCIHLATNSARTSPTEDTR